jgi:NhaA family Na+:H+ antiporter
VAWFFPALIYTFINWENSVAITGWAIPAATDIAFALGVVMILGDRIPTALKVCLVAIAIIDDLMAVIIIALFYTSEISMQSLVLAGAGLVAVAWMNRKGITSLGPYIVIGIFIWACVLKSGVHATLAGVALGFMIPLRAKDDEGKSPLKVMEHALYPWVSFGVVPLFAFVNAGISLKEITLETFLEPITLGIMLGLFFGKQIGVMLITMLACRLRLCHLPRRCNVDAVLRYGSFDRDWLHHESFHRNSGFYRYSFCRAYTPWRYERLFLVSCGRNHRFITDNKKAKPLDDAT